VLFTQWQVRHVISFSVDFALVVCSAAHCLVQFKLDFGLQSYVYAFSCADLSIVNLNCANGDLHLIKNHVKK
jgi:hypothetical protein